MKICSWSTGISRHQMTLLQSADGVSLSASPREWRRGPHSDRVSVLHRWSLSHKPHPARKKEAAAAAVWSLSSLFLSLSLLQIKISVIKLIKVMHASMPLGSRPDFIRHTVVESCGSSTFDVAFFIIENNWILPPLSLSLSLSLSHTHTFSPCSLWACSVNRPLVRQCWCRVYAPSGGFRQLFSRVGSGLCLKKTDLSSPGSVLRDVTSARVRGHSAGWSGACQWVGAVRLVGAVAKPTGALLLYLHISLAEHKKRASLAHRQLASLHTQRNGW